MSQILVFLDWSSNVLIFSCLLKDHFFVFLLYFLENGLNFQTFYCFVLFFYFDYLVFNFQEFFCLMFLSVLFNALLFLIHRYSTFSQLSKILLMTLKQRKMHFFCFPSYLHFPLSFSLFSLPLPLTHALSHTFSSVFLIKGYPHISEELLPIHI